jgi:hypothetical protein
MLSARVFTQGNLAVEVIAALSATAVEMFTLVYHPTPG